MAVVFLDGIDGSGKTTLLHRLTAALPPDQTVMAPPLWQFLPALSTAADFATWVTTTDGAEIAVDLLGGQVHRRASVERLAHEAGSPGVVLVDRGPVTVVASAHAHLATGTRTGPQPAKMISDHTGRLSEVVARLATDVRCLSIELRVDGSHDRILNRLTDAERTDSRYQHYLAALHDELVSASDLAWTGVRRVRLDATSPASVNVARAQAAVRRLLR